MRRKSETSAAAKVLAKRGNKKTLTKSPLTDEQIIDRARDWAHLHTDPQTRPQMDKIIDGLSPADARRVVLCGQRVRAGLSARIAK